MMPPADYIKNPERLMCQRSPEEERNQACRFVKRDVVNSFVAN